MTTTPSLASGKARYWIPLLSFLAILFDGFDTTLIGIVVPTMSREWGLPPGAFTPAFIATSVGAVIGYMVCGQLASRLGRRALILGAVLLFAVGSVATGWVTSIAQLAVLRLITSIGLGAAVPACVSIAVDSTDPRRREMVTVAVTSGLALGAALSGALGGRLIEAQGWHSMFWLGGLLPALLLPALWLVLPREMPIAATAPRAAAVSTLFEGPLKRNTTLLWGFSFCIFTALYAMMFWVPTLLLSFNFDRTSVSLGAAALGGGGFVAGLLLVPVTAWLGISRVLVCTTLAAALLIVALSQLSLAPSQVLLTVGLLGGCLVCGTIGQTALAVSLYPAASRTAGVGWSAALGRLGSIFGPAIGGALISMGQTPRDVLLNLCVPLVLAVVLLASAKIGMHRAASPA